MSHRLSPASLAAIAAACLLSACTPIRPPANLSVAPVSVLPARPGDHINGLILKAVAAKALSIWELCQPNMGTPNTCFVSARTSLAIGPDTSVMVDGSHTPGGDPQVWELYLDDRPIDLTAFDTIQFGRYHKGPFGQSEVFAIHQTWNVAILPVSGQHALRSVLRPDQPSNNLAASNAAPRAWVLTFAVSE